MHLCESHPTPRRPTQLTLFSGHRKAQEVQGQEHTEPARELLRPRDGGAQDKAQGQTELVVSSSGEGTAPCPGLCRPLPVANLHV